MAHMCVIRQSGIPLDARGTREIEALVAAGHDVDVICLRVPGQPLRERDGRLTIYRVPLERKRRGVLRYLFEYAAFFVAAGALVTALHLRRRYAVVQVNSLPDSLVFAAAVPRLLGAGIVLDLYECMPEFFAMKFKLPPRHAFVRLLMLLEQASIRFADAVITSTELMRERFVERGAPREKIAISVNGSDERRFDPRRYPGAPRRPDRFVLICHGSIEEHYGLDTVLHAIALLKGEMPGLRLVVFGDGTQRTPLQALANELSVADRVSFSQGWAPIEALLRAIADADAGVLAIKRNDFRDLTHCSRMFDLIVMRKPVIMSRTRAVEASFGEGCFQLFESGDAHDLARAIRELAADPALAERLVARAALENEPYRWSRQEPRYVAVVEGAARGGRVAAMLPVAAEASEDA